MGISLEQMANLLHEERMGRFEKGVSVDPTINMTPEEKSKWEAMNAEYRDKFKKADAPLRQRLSWDKEAAGSWDVTYYPTNKDDPDVKKGFGSQHLAENWVKGSGIVRRSDIITIENSRTNEAYDYNFSGGRFVKKRMASVEKEARAPSGLYGYTKATQRDCEASISKIRRFASRTARSAYGKDNRVAEFFGTYAKRAKSNSARVLMAALKELSPKFAYEQTRGFPVIDCQQDHLRAIESAMHDKMRGVSQKEARDYGMYGFPAKTVRLGLEACSSVKEHAGVVASDLHRRRQASYTDITGFFKQHSKEARCHASRMILGCYPDETYKFASDEKARNLEEPSAFDISWE